MRPVPSTLWFAVAALLAVSALWAQTLHPHTYPVLIQKDERGRLTEASRQRLTHALEEIEEYGFLRAWVEANFDYTPLEPGDGQFDAQQRRLRALLRRVVARLDNAMEDTGPDEEYPAVGPYVNVNVDEEGARALIEDRDVQAFFVLIPSY